MYIVPIMLGFTDELPQANVVPAGPFVVSIHSHVRVSEPRFEFVSFAQGVFVTEK